MMKWYMQLFVTTTFIWCCLSVTFANDEIPSLIFERATTGKQVLWYAQPADFIQTENTQKKPKKKQPSAWLSALPVGNGRLGAMVFGGVPEERIQLNEDTLWAGPPIPQNPTEVHHHLAAARTAWFTGDYALCEQHMNQMLGERIVPRSHQTLGDLHLHLKHSDTVKDYYRDLNLDTAIATTRYKVDGITYTRRVFCTAVDDVLVVEISADQPQAINMEVSLDRPRNFEIQSLNHNTLIMHGQAQHGENHQGVRFVTQVRAITQGGGVTAEAQKLIVQKADRATLYLSAATDYHRENPRKALSVDLKAQCQSVLDKAIEKSFAQILRDHMSEHQGLYRRVSLDLGTTEASRLPIDQRLAAVKAGGVDPELITLYFQYGRYLLIGSSRPDCMPANLQGLWNDKMEAPWNADYHININLQMNYWPAEVTNLSECHEPFFDFIERLLPQARKTAKQVYDCNGVVAHHTTDAWLWTAPIGRLQYGMWPHGIGWCTQHFMEHYRYTGDKVFLRERAYPVLAEASRFYLDWLVKDPKTGRLVSGPSTSPENVYRGPNGKNHTVSMGCAMDQQIIWDVFTNTLESAKLLNLDNELVNQVRAALTQLAETQIGADGRLMEWSRAFEEPSPGHRHMSHLFAMHPGRQYSFNRRPEMIAAARKSIEHRLAHGGGHTGWSRAWIINFWARLRDAEKAYENVLALLRKSTTTNLFDLHPPFQIDGNFGGCAGIAEMLLQSHDSEIHLLPALPAAWPTGSVTGLCARGGFIVDMEWRDGQLVQAQVTSRLGGACRIRIGEQKQSHTCDTKIGQVIRVTPKGIRID